MLRAREFSGLAGLGTNSFFYSFVINGLNMIYVIPIQAHSWESFTKLEEQEEFTCKVSPCGTLLRRVSIFAKNHTRMFQSFELVLTCTFLIMSFLIIKSRNT